MSFEVYAGSRPGNRRLLILLATGTFLATIGAAWVQTQQKRAPGAEIRVGNTPIFVRLPRDWRPDPRHPNRFRLAPEDASRAVFERRLQFDFSRLRSYQPVSSLLATPEVVGPGQRHAWSAARLGPYDAVEVRSLVTEQLRRFRIAREVVVRFTCLPTGHVIRVLYEPLADLTPGDIEMLESICQSLRLEGAAFEQSPAQLLRRAGVELPPDAAPLTVGYDVPQVPAVFLRGAEDGLPTWALAIFRTWIAPGRSGRDLLRDFAAENWLEWNTARLLDEERRADGATVTTIRSPPAAAGVQPPGSSLSARVVAQDANVAAILFLYADAADRESAEMELDRITAAMRLRPVPEIPDLAAAAAAGRRLTTDLRRGGPAARWGREPKEVTYHRANADEVVIVRRAAIDRNPASGYEGMLWRRVGRLREERQIWTMDASATVYEWSAEYQLHLRTMHVREQRSDANTPVVRELHLDGEQIRSWKFTPGELFTPPPAESIVEGWMAREDWGPALLEVSTPIGPGSHSVLLRHLEPDGAYARVLAQADFWPVGIVIAFDDAQAEVEYQLEPGAEYRRTP